MAKVSVTMTLDEEVLALVDADARARGLNRSQQVERALRAEHWARYWGQHSRLLAASGFSNADASAHDTAVREAIYGKPA